ncbi:MAG: TonB-dependent receptor [Bacteroidetes bacterium]|nr:TonB-dependent receptor [Bacteroidota bacterium]
MNFKNFIAIIIFTSLIIFFSVCNLSGQTATIRGFVYEKETGEPVIFTNVYLSNTTFGSATDVNGYYIISNIPAGSYELMVTNLGYDTLRMSITLKPDEIVNKKLYLKKGSYTLETINVSADKYEMRTETRTSVVKITPKQIRQIPSIGGQPDLAQYLQVLPGVIFTGDQGGQLYIRGGSPIQNKVLLDGMVIYNPFHSIGLFSVFDTDILRNADIYTGGFNAEYGGRISSIMDITTRDGNKKRIAGKIGVSTFGAKVMIEGPLKKQSETGGGSSSFIFSAKNSYLEQSSKLFYNYIDTTGLPFNYTDIYGKISINAANGSKINFFGFSFNDKVNNYKA